MAGWCKSLVIYVLVPIIAFLVYRRYRAPIQAISRSLFRNQELVDGDEPIVLWWHQTGSEKFNYYKTCGTNRCYFTENRLHLANNRTKAILLYGSFTRPYDLPLPRLPHHEWGLLHDESPKNNYMFSHGEVMELFNHTATFKRESTYPIPTYWIRSLDWMESKSFMKTTEEKNKYLTELAPVAYIQSDCDAPSGRDDVVKEMMKYIKVDSYGKCLHNQELPESLRDPIKGMMNPEFFEFLSRYKFILAMENALCDDYMTEKLWRPLHVGSVPIVLGSSKVQDFLPSNLSAIVVNNFKTIKELVNYIKFLNENDAEYDKYLSWKHSGVENARLKEELKTRTYELPKLGFECHVCNKIHENKQRQREGKPEHVFHANKSHYGCPGPVYYKDGDTKFDKNRPFAYHYYVSKYEAKAIRHFIGLNKTYTDDQYYMYLHQHTDGQLRIVKSEH